MPTAKLLTENMIRTAVIIDDGYDIIPKPDELRDHNGWRNFFDDSELYNDQLIEIFPGFAQEDEDDLKQSEEFISTLWKNRDALGAFIAPLFEDYIRDSEQDNAYLAVVENTLTDLKLEVTKVGRVFSESASTADLIVIDLFLGNRQGEAEYQTSMSGLKAVLNKRENNLPTIILMSRSSNMEVNGNKFREEAKIHASSFRSIRKSDINKPGRLTHLLITLAKHRKSSLKLASFVQTWRKGLNKAVENTETELRRIDIDDLVHTRHLLLKAEGSNTSSYMLDVFDRVFQYELEAEEKTLTAASSLNDIADTDFPPLTLSSEKDAYRLLEKTLYVNNTRRNHDTGAFWPVAFGDILTARADVSITKNGIFEGARDRVFMVVTAACDLQRENKTKRAMLMAGKLCPITSNAPFEEGNIHTPIFVDSSLNRFRIDWTPTDVRTISRRQLTDLLHPNGTGVVAGRLREVAAISLQQQFLGNLGRVGELVPPPRSYSINVKFFVPAVDNSLVELVLPNGNEIAGTCIVNKDDMNAHIIFDHSRVFDLWEAINECQVENVHTKSRKKLGQVKSLELIDRLFHKGILTNYPVKNSEAKLPINDKSSIIGRLVIDMELETSFKSDQAKQAAGLIFHIRSTSN